MQIFREEFNLIHKELVEINNDLATILDDAFRIPSSDTEAPRDIFS